jgi:F-type H+-transporting ATPase subunit b
MDLLISTFHIDGGLLLAQIVNFALVFAILYFFAFKPLVQIMTERSAKIDKSLKDAEEIEQRLADAATEREAIIAAGKKQANLILEEADKRGEERRNELVAQAKEEIGQAINNEKAKLSREKAETLKEIKHDVAGLVAATVEKLLHEKMTSDQDHDLIKKLIK